MSTVMQLFTIQGGLEAQDCGADAFSYVSQMLRVAAIGKLITARASGMLVVEVLLPEDIGPAH